MINRHNYEEFFLLFVDDELTPDQRLAVQAFLQQNPDLQVELDMLLQTTLEAEPVTFDQKERLFNPAEGVTANNYEEFFLLAVDKELTAREADEVEKFVLKHPELQNEYVLIQQAKLAPEEVIFEGKSRLYKNAGERRFLLTRFRMGVAAAILGLALSLWMINGKQQGQLPVAAIPGKKVIQAIPQQPAPALTATLVAIPPATKSPAEHSSARVKMPTVITKKIATIQLKEATGKLASNETGSAIDPARSPGAEPVAVQPIQTTEPAVAGTSSGNRNNLPVVGQTEKFTPTEEIPVADYSPSLAKHVVYREIDSKNDDEDRSFYIGSAEINKSKLKGLFKKAAGFFGKKNDTEEGEKSLKIAGFEIRSN